tara:strand:- start:650 stop:898 length:249 start_codon:yes stop_codon:yes gene_type:complete
MKDLGKDKWGIPYRNKQEKDADEFSFSDFVLLACYVFGFCVGVWGIYKHIIGEAWEATYFPYILFVACGFSIWYNYLYSKKP